MLSVLLPSPPVTPARPPSAFSPFLSAHIIPPPAARPLSPNPAPSSSSPNAALHHSQGAETLGASVGAASSMSTVAERLRVIHKTFAERRGQRP